MPPAPPSRDRLNDAIESLKDLEPSAPGQETPRAVGEHLLVAAAAIAAVLDEDRRDRHRLEQRLKQVEEYLYAIDEKLANMVKVLDSR